MNTDKITVLGKTFNSEEERREYYRNELRNHLPELKKMEGFPIGEDEDIINLSDPPYYTACPNPWLNDFIAEWEEEKKELEKVGKRSADYMVDEPYASDVSEGKNNPIYNAHSYHTKVPHPAIMRYILHYTQPGDIVYDGFAGTGMTGVAAALCLNPDISFKYVLERDSINVKWGKRNAICGDLSPIASFISSNYNLLIDVESFVNQSLEIINLVEKKYNYLYITEHENDKLGVIKNVIWSDVFDCPNCGNEIVFYEVAVDESSGKVLKDIVCSSCSSVNSKRSLKPIWETIYDPILKETIRQVKKIPVRIEYNFNGKKFIKKPNSKDINIIENIVINDLQIPSDRMPNGGEARRNDRQGITHTHHFYSSRTLFILNELYKYSFSNTFKLLLNSQLANLSKLNRNRPGVSFPYNPLSGTLYIGSQICEANVFTAYRNKIKRFSSALSLITQNQLTQTSSATQVKIHDNSVDYIFTDPPFGANISYSELNFISEAFLKVKTNYSVEAIENKSRGTFLFDYIHLMNKSLKEFYRVLKPGKWMTVEFSNTSAAVWNGIQTSLQNVGLVIANISALDKKQGSFKAVTTVTAVKQDLIISCYKPSSEFSNKFKQYQNTDIAIWDFAEEHLNHLPIHLVKENSTTAIIERSPKILFDRLIAFYVQKGLPVPIDAGKFQQGLRERFVETDGMFFTVEQAAEYDKKKAEHPDFVQLSLLVASEQDGVLWLKNKLSEQPMTYQDIHPEWMQALSGLRKGDILPELEVLLKDNFLKDEEGRWYQPDPENEIDLEKLRTKRLLKQFDIYRTEAAKPKTKKIKEVRVEALRTGFKNCYQEKDFKTIVEIGNKIPENLLMEDEVLLQFYDIASNKI